MLVNPKVRSAVLSSLPPGLRWGLKRARDHVQQVESRVRARLPQALGGRFATHALGARCLTPEDHRAWRRLRPDESADHAPPAVLSATDERFVMGVWTCGRLVAAGFCSIMSDGREPYALLAGDFVHPAFRRRGVAQRLHSARLAELARRGVGTVYAWVDPINFASIAALCRSGFARVPAALAPAALPRSRREQVLLRASVLAPA